MVTVRSVLSLLALALAAALLASGCGSSSKPYTLAATRKCLAERTGLTLRRHVDFVASTALGGAVNVKLEANQVTIAFALDDAEAARLGTAYRRFRGQNIGIEDVLRSQRNAVLLWEAHPSDADLATIERCLKH